VSSWGKTRFDRNGEQDLGVLLFSFVAVWFLHHNVLKWLSPAASAKAEGANAGKKTTWQRFAAKFRRTPEYTTSRFWAFFLMAALVMILFSTQAGLTGAEFLKAAKKREDTTLLADDLSKDAIVAVYSGFWIGGAVGSARQEWVIEVLTSRLLWAWGIGTVLLLWAPVILAGFMLRDEIGNAIDGGNGKLPGADERLVVWVAVLVSDGLATAAFVALFFHVSRSIQGTTPGSTTRTYGRRTSLKNAILGAASDTLTRGLSQFMGSAETAPPVRSVVCAPLLPHLPLKC